MSRFGQFSQLWADMAQRLGLDVICIDGEWGEGVPLEDTRAPLAADPSIKGGLRHPQRDRHRGHLGHRRVRAVMDAAGSDALLYVDAVSSLASIPFEQEAWGVDLAVSGSQKGLMLPPGWPCSGSATKPWRRSPDRDDGALLLQLRGHGARPTTWATSPTPRRIPCCTACAPSLDLLFAEGLPQVFDRHHRLAEGVRRGVDALGLQLCALGPQWYSDTVTAIRTPDGVDGTEVCRIGYHRYRTSFGAG